MKQLAISHSLTQSFSEEHDKLVSLILEVIQSEKVYLLGTSLSRCYNESIFNNNGTTVKRLSHCFFLILTNNLNNKTLYEWQDKIEQHCSSIMPVTTIVLEASTFNDWLKTGHLFARTVCQSAIPLYDTGNINLSSPKDYNKDVGNKSLEKYYMEGLNKAQEFLAGADLFRIRAQNKMAAFMLHQSAEQALRTLLKIGTGFHSCTHNLERLIRYGSMVSCQLMDVFPGKTENEKHLFSLLQKAYIDTRYKEDYTINFSNLNLLTERVKKIQELLIVAGKIYVQPANIKETKK